MGKVRERLGRHLCIHTCTHTSRCIQTHAYSYKKRGPSSGIPAPTLRSPPLA